MFKKDNIPYLIIFIILALMAAGTPFILNKVKGKSSFLSVGNDAFVTLDVIKIVNAQRKMLGDTYKTDPNDLAIISSQIGRLMENTIDTAASGRTVLVKQAVVSSNLEDITDQVLESLDLPKEVPGLDLSSAWKPPVSSLSIDPQAFISDKRGQESSNAYNNMMKEFMKEKTEKYVP